MKQYHLINVLQLVFTSLFFVSATFFLTAKMNPAIPVSPAILDWDIATISLIITATGTFFAIFFRWRADVRNSKFAAEQAQKTELRFNKLENEIKLIKAKLK